MCPPLTFPRCPCSRGRCRLPSAPCGPAGAGGQGWFPLPPPPRCRRPARPRWLRGGPAGRCGHLRGRRELTEGSRHVPKTFKPSPQQPRSPEVHPHRLGGLKEQGGRLEIPVGFELWESQRPPCTLPVPARGRSRVPSTATAATCQIFQLFRFPELRKKERKHKKM